MYIQVHVMSMYSIVCGRERESGRGEVRREWERASLYVQVCKGVKLAY